MDCSKEFRLGHATAVSMVAGTDAKKAVEMAFEMAGGLADLTAGDTVVYWADA